VNVDITVDITTQSVIIDDYVLQFMKTFSQYSNFEFGLFIICNHHHKGLKYLTLHVMSLYNILVSPLS